MPLKLKETTDCWDFLAKTELPIFMYGMGLGAEKILGVFEQYGIACAGFFASDGFVRGHYFKDHLVHSLSEIEEQVPEFIVVLAFAAGYEELYDYIQTKAPHYGNGDPEADKYLQFVADTYANNTDFLIFY